MTPQFEKLLAELKELAFPDGQYAIYGSGPLAIRDIRDARDLDVIVSDKLYQKLKERYPENSEKKEIKIGEIEISSVQDWKPEINDLEKVIERAEIIQGLRFTTLDDLIRCKKKMGRPKDFEDIKLIENYLSQ